MKQKVLCGFLTGIMLLSLAGYGSGYAATATDASPFTDVPSDAWYAESVLWCRANGILNGTTNTTFDPNRSLTRGMTVTALHRAEGLPAHGSNEAFTDNPTGTYYHDAVLWAASKGIVSGYGNGQFGPDNPVTREQLAAILWRHAGEPSATSPDLADESTISGFASTAVDWAVSNSIVRPVEGNRFAPKENATRADVAVALYACLSNQSATEHKVLVAYFSRMGNIDSEHEVDAVTSASVVVQNGENLGNLEYLAKLIQENTGGDLFFIETANKYSSDYDNTDSNELDLQAEKEHNENARPELASHVDDMAQYDTVFLGFPTWMYDLPMAVYSFLDEYDLTGKTVYLFNSRGGGERNYANIVQELEPDAIVSESSYSVGHSSVDEVTAADIQAWLSEAGYQQ